MGEFARSTHGSGMEGVDLAIFFIAEDICLWRVASRNRLDKFRIDTHITKSHEVFHSIFPYGSDDIGTISKERERIGDIRGSSTIFLANHGRKKREMKMNVGSIILRTKFANSLNNGIEGYGSGDKERHNGGVNYKVYDIMYQILSF